MTTVPLPEPVSHVDAVRELIARVREIQQSIPGFEYNNKIERQRLNLAAGVPDRFLDTVSVAIEASDTLNGAAAVRSAEVRDVIEFSRAYRSLAEELQLVADGALYTIALRRAKISDLARRAYALSKSLNRPSDRAVLVPHIDAMRRALNRTRPKSQTTDAAPAPAPAPPPQPPLPAGAA
jgi:hypothetical protein